ncbi:uncharacterized protein B0H64DRAFT_442571 [Chaetomium fimeti]|uniref:Nudix hydrolase domain-containing protein n=1 Tax=Chaetomium fimeti TaxID=1854472 RepID=A0AAE0HH70_9PEZI|nr:hypothetical protein B0H64DRAFT_442571 [Chaetomium fimeti]
MPPPQPPQDQPPTLEHDPSLEAFNIPVQDWLAANPEHQLIVSAIVSLPSSFPSFNPNQPRPQPPQEDDEKEERTLLLQRAPTDQDPLTWEHPGGGCNPHETLLQAVARELAEETGLVARRVAGLVTTLDIPEPGFDEVKRGRGVRGWWRLFCFLVEIQVEVEGEVEGGVENGGEGEGDGGGDGVGGLLPLPVVRLDPEEHCAYVWATEGEVRRGECGGVEMRWDGEGNMRKGVILRGFEVLRERRALARGRGVMGGV